MAETRPKAQYTILARNQPDDNLRLPLFQSPSVASKADCEKGERAALYKTNNQGSLKTDLFSAHLNTQDVSFGCPPSCGALKALFPPLYNPLISSTFPKSQNRNPTAGLVHSACFWLRALGGAPCGAELVALPAVHRAPRELSSAAKKSGDLL